MKIIPSLTAGDAIVSLPWATVMVPPNSTAPSKVGISFARLSILWASVMAASGVRDAACASGCAETGLPVSPWMKSGKRLELPGFQ